MHLNASTISTVIALVSLVLALGALFGRQRKAATTANLIAEYSQSAEAWESLATARDEKIKQQDALITSLQAHVAELSAKLQVLEDLVTGRTAVEQLSAQLAEGFRQMDQKIVGKDEWTSFRDEVRRNFAALGGT